MKRYLFLLSWVHGSESAENNGVTTYVHKQEDLLPEYGKNNEEVFALRIVAPNEDVACNFGYAEAFHENYTGYDTVSICVEIDGTIVGNLEETKLITVDCTVA